MKKIKCRLAELMIGMDIEIFRDVQGADDDDVLAEFEKSGVADPAGMMEEWRKNGQMYLLRQGILRQKAAKEIVDNAIVVEEKPEKAEEKAGKHAMAEEEAEAEAE